MDILSRLIGAGADINIVDSIGWAPIRYSSLGGHLDILNRLIDASADVNIVDNGRVASIHFACHNRHLDMLNRLIGAGADIYAKDNQGRSPVDLVVVSNELYRVLLRDRAGPSKQTCCIIS